MKANRKPGHRLIINWKDNPSTSTHTHKYGGNPSNKAVLPLCGNCGESLHLMFQIDVTDPQLNYLNLKFLSYLFVVTCLNCASYERPMYYRIEHDGREIVVLKEMPRIGVHQYPHPLEEHSVSLRPLTEDEYPLTEDELFDLLEQQGKHQLAGMPLWVQDEENMPCIVCNNRMEYIAMVDTELYIGEDGFREKGHTFGDRGILYVFICRKCNILSVIAQGS